MAYPQPAHAYGQMTGSQAPDLAQRRAEITALKRVNDALIKGAKHRKSRFPDLVRALHENRQLWTVFACGVADETNRLPPELRAQIYYLAEFVTAHSAKVMTDGASVKPLVEINRLLLSGLLQQQARVA